MTAPRLQVGAATLVRVPYAEILVDAPVVSLTDAQVRAIPWAAPQWADDGQVRVAAAVWIIESCGRRIVVDPAQAADSIIREGPDAAVHQAAVADALAAAGFARESIDTVIATHIDGIGMIAWRDGDDWTPFFPNATVLLSRRELDAIADDGPYHPQGGDALLALNALGAVTPVDDELVVTDDVTLRRTGGHTAGHQVVDLASEGASASMIGHLALSPLHCAVTEHSGHEDPVVAWRALSARRDAGSVLVGPLWPAPGAARWDGVEMTPAKMT